MATSRVHKPVLCLALALGLAAFGGMPVAGAQEQGSDDFNYDDLFGESTSEAPAGEADESSAQDQGQDQDQEQDQSSSSQAGQQPEDVEVIELADKPKPALETEPPPKRRAALEEIVVTARKREESIQDVPLSVTPFNAAELEQRGFNGLEDIAAATPGFTFEGFITGGAHGNAVIRGLAQQFTTSRIQNVSFFLDGVYLQRQSMLNLGLVDMERVEVVKGPQNALYGRNAFAGAVNYITKRPRAEREGYLSAGIGDNERREYRLSLAGPLNKNATWLGKLTAGFSSYDGHTRNDHPVANADPPGPNLRGNLGGFDDETYSAALAYEPSDALRFQASYYRTDATHETQPGYSISGVNAARFGLRFDDQNDLNCNVATVPDIQPQPPRTHTGFSAYCGELPAYASDIAPRRVDGIVIDPRAIGTIAETDAVTFTSDYDLTDALSAHYLYGYADHSSYTDGGVSDEDPIAGRGINVNAIITQVDNQNPAAYAFVNTSSSRPNSELKSFSHELRFDWQFSPSFRSSAGLYYSKVRDEEWTSLFLSDLCNADTPENIANCNREISAPNTLAERTVLTAAAAWDQYTRQHGDDVRGEYTAFEDDVSAVFASFTYGFTPRLEGTIEGRYTVENKSVDRYTDSFAIEPGTAYCYGANCAGPPPPRDPCPDFRRINDPLAPVVPAGNVLCSAITKPHDEATFKDVTPRAILNWQFLDEHMVYVSAAKGVKTGGFNNADSPTELTYDPEENWTYELGSKNSFFGRAWTLNGAVYYVDWTNLQGGVPPAVAGLSTSDIITNIGDVTSIGVEMESNLRLPFGFSIDLGGTYNKATYNDGVKYAAGRQDTGAIHCDDVTCPADGDVSGNQLARTSKVQWSAGINHVADLYGVLIRSRIDTNYQSRQYMTPLNLAWVPDRRITNASLGFSSPGDQWELNIWGKNLTNEDYPASAFVIGVFNQYMVGKGAGRTWGAALKYNF